MCASFAGFVSREVDGWKIGGGFLCSECGVVEMKCVCSEAGRIRERWIWV